MTYQKIEAIRRRIDAVNPAIRLEVDGGGKSITSELSKRPARILCAGTAIFGTDDYGAVISACVRR